MTSQSPTALMGRALPYPNQPPPPSVDHPPPTNHHHQHAVPTSIACSLSGTPSRATLRQRHSVGVSWKIYPGLLCNVKHSTKWHHSATTQRVKSSEIVATKVAAWFKLVTFLTSDAPEKGWSSGTTRLTRFDCCLKPDPVFWRAPWRLRP